MKWERQADRRRPSLRARPVACTRRLSFSLSPSRLPSPESFSLSLSLSFARFVTPFLSLSHAWSPRIFPIPETGSRVREPRTVLRWLRCNERPRQETRGRSCIQVTEVQNAFNRYPIDKSAWRNGSIFISQTRRYVETCWMPIYAGYV